MSENEHLSFVILNTVWSFIFSFLMDHYFLQRSQLHPAYFRHSIFLKLEVVRTKLHFSWLEKLLFIAAQYILLGFINYIFLSDVISLELFSCCWCIYQWMDSVIIKYFSFDSTFNHWQPYFLLCFSSTNIIS